MRKIFLICVFIYCSFLCSCASPRKNNNKIQNSVQKYSFKDISGEYDLKRKVIVGKVNEYIVSQEIFSKGQNTNPLEKSITVSQFGFITKNKVKMSLLRPKISQYSIWFEGKKYFSQMKTNFKDRKLEIILKSPEEKWNGKKSVPFPRGDSVFCFFSQLTECIGATKYFSQAVKKEGSISFYIIWDGYPYIQEQFEKVATNVFSLATFQYDGKPDGKMHRFSLSVDGQSIFYLMDDKFSLSQISWVSQGILMKSGEV